MPVEVIKAPVRLNIGAGRTAIDGFTSIDRGNDLVGCIEAYPLDCFDTDSVEEIRASHILEHFGYAEVALVLAEWVRVLKPGGRIRIAVPDFDKIAGELKDDPLRMAYLFGGQTDENDYHKTAWTRWSLHDAMRIAGIVEIEPWESENTDCAALPVSLNLSGVKGEPSALPTGTIKIAAVMSVPRFGSMASRGIIEDALHKMKIPLNTSQGVFWDQCMQRHFEKSCDDGCDWILSLDFDSVFTAEQLSQLMDRFGQNPDIDCLVALQCRRGGQHPLMTVGNTSGDVETDGKPILCTTAHFGLTLIRTDCLKEVEKPWFFAQPDEDNQWGDSRLDADIWFWHQWRKAMYNIYIDPTVRIGHVEECVSMFDDELDVVRLTVEEWREISK